MRVLIIFAVLSVLMLMVIGCAPQGDSATDKNIPTGPRVATTETAKYVYGPDTAKVKIEAYYPLNEKHTKMLEFLVTQVEKYPDQVQVTTWDFRTSEGGEACKAAFGKICGGMLINGKSDFTVNVDGETKEINILGGEWVSWTKPEVEAAVAQVVAETYPESE